MVTRRELAAAIISHLPKNGLRTSVSSLPHRKGPQLVRETNLANHEAGYYRLQAQSLVFSAKAVITYTPCMFASEDPPTGILKRERELNVLSHVRSHVYTSVFGEAISAPRMNHAWARDAAGTAKGCQSLISTLLSAVQLNLQGLVEKLWVVFTNSAIPSPSSHHLSVPKSCKYLVQVVHNGLIAFVVQPHRHINFDIW